MQTYFCNTLISSCTRKRVSQISGSLSMMSSRGLPLNKSFRAKQLKINNTVFKFMITKAPSLQWNIHTKQEYGFCLYFQFLPSTPRQQHLFSPWCLKHPRCMWHWLSSDVCISQLQYYSLFERIHYFLFTSIPHVAHVEYITGTE